MSNDSEKPDTNSSSNKPVESSGGEDILPQNVLNISDQGSRRKGQTAKSGAQSMARSRKVSVNENSPPDNGQEGNEVTFKPLGKNDLALIMPSIIEYGKKSFVYESSAITAALPPFGRVFKRYKPPAALACVVEILDGDIVRIVPLEDVRDAIIAWARLPPMPGTAREVMEILFSSVLDAADAMRQATNWLASFTEGAMEELPPAVRFASDKGLCFARLPFDLYAKATLAECPSWAAVLERITTNADAFAMRIASLFDKNANRKQALWLWGKGDTGKSLIIEVIGECFGSAFHPSNSKAAKGEFWLYTLVGKRLVYINECSTSFVTNEDSDFKGITGERSHLVNRKGRDHMPVRLDALLVMTANPKLKLPADDALHNRIIDCHINPLPNALKHSEENAVRDALRSELRAFLSYGWEMYQARKFPNGRIPVDGESLQEGTDEYYEEAYAILEMLFEQLPGAETPAVDVRRHLNANGRYPDNRTYAHWVEAWEREGIRKRRRRKDGGAKEVVFEGLRPKALDARRTVVT